MDQLAEVLLRRHRTVYLPQPTAAAPGDGPAWTRALEADLAGRGWLLDRDLVVRFAVLEPTVRAVWADWILAMADQAVGADRDHVPLFRRFPDTPADPDALYVERLLTHLFQVGAAPCVLCGAEGTVQPLAPCGHLVCTACFDPISFSACPVCGRRIGNDAPYLPMAAAAPGVAAKALPPVGPIVGLRAGTDRVADAARLRDGLVDRPRSLSPADVDDLRVLVAATTTPGDVSWLPERIPARETLAVVCADALAAARPGDTAAITAVAARWSTTTDVARTLWAYSGGPASLVLPAPRPDSGPYEGWRLPAEPAVAVSAPRVRALPRSWRRAILAHLDAMHLPTVCEDLSRHPTVWKRLAERLHPFEAVSCYPAAATAFATLRATRAQPESRLGKAMAAAATSHPERIILATNNDGTVSVRSRSFAALVEAALEAGDPMAALDLLAGRPGELWRRLDHLARLAGDDPALVQRILAAGAAATGAVAPGVLAAAAAEMAGRDRTVAATPEQVAATAATRLPAPLEAEVGARRRRPWDLRSQRPAPSKPGGARAGAPTAGMPRRLFFPKGDVVHTWTTLERRAPLPGELCAAVRAMADQELVHRAARLEPFDLAVVDARLAHVPAPTREGASAGQLAGWPRGARIPLPFTHGPLRLFLHWTDTGTSRVDLDLSAALFNDQWDMVGHCDYTRLRFADGGAIHSGDLTSAPPPLGATEFMDLDSARLIASGVRYAAAVVFSYNDVPFDALEAAFAGLAVPGPGAGRELLEAGRVLQRFDLRGDARALLPLILDLAEGEVVWADVNLRGLGYAHAIGRYRHTLGRVAGDLWNHFASGSRASALDVVAAHAVGRAARIVVAHPDGTASAVPEDLAPSEAVAAIRALAAGGPPSEASTPTSPGGRIFVATFDQADVNRLGPGDPEAGSLAVTVTGTAPDRYVSISLADLFAGLVPTAPAD